MAHHLAELLAEVEKCRKASDRKAAKDRAASTILRIWERRQQLPGTAYPLSQYRKAAAVLAAINLQPNRLETGRGPIAAGSVGLTLGVYSAASRLALFALVDLLPKRKGSVDPALLALLKDEEREYLQAIEGIYKLLGSSSQRSSKSKRVQASVAIDVEGLRRSRLELVDELARDIENLKKVLTDHLPSNLVKPVSLTRGGTQK